MGRGMGVEGSMNYALEKLMTTESEFWAKNWTNYVLEKLRELEMGAEEWINFVPEKLKEFLAELEHLGKTFMAKVDEVFPPDTRVEQLKHWAQVAAPYVIVAAVFLILFRCFRCCCGHSGSGGSAVKMMIAPGTGRSFKIPRPSFEASPRSYFQSLRGK